MPLWLKSQENLKTFIVLQKENSKFAVTTFLLLWTPLRINSFSRLKNDITFHNLQNSLFYVTETVNQDWAQTKHKNMSYVVLYASYFR